MANSFACLDKRKETIQTYIDLEMIPGSLQERFDCIFKSLNIKSDSNKNRVDLSDLLPVTRSTTQTITGKIKYYKLINKKYKYDVTLDKETNNITVKVNIFFYPSRKLDRNIKKCASNNTPKCVGKIDSGTYNYYPNSINELFQNIDKKLIGAEEIWNKDAPKNISFSFSRVSNKKDSHYKVRLNDSLGALYDKYIWHNYRADVFAHEIGHMMGLGEEYNPITSNIIPIYAIANKLFKKGESFEKETIKDMRCNLKSIMCLQGKVYPYHYEEILGRIQK
jgi:hypothetical protein